MVLKSQTESKATKCILLQKNKQKKKNPTSYTMLILAKNILDWWYLCNTQCFLQTWSYTIITLKLLWHNWGDFIGHMYLSAVVTLLMLQACWIAGNCLHNAFCKNEFDKCNFILWNKQGGDFIGDVYMSAVTVLMQGTCWNVVYTMFNDPYLTLWLGLNEKNIVLLSM